MYSPYIFIMRNAINKNFLTNTVLYKSMFYLLLRLVETESKWHTCEHLFMVDKYHLFLNISKIQVRC